MSKTPPAQRVERVAHLRWVPIEQMKVNPLSQRDINPARVDHLVANLDLERLGYPTVSQREGSYFVIDGQHRVEALRAFGLGDSTLECWVYNGLSEQDEAEAFLKLNDTLTVSGFAKFRVAVNAGREVECDIQRVLQAEGLCVSQDKIPGAIAAVGTLRRGYPRSDGKNLARTLRIIRDAYGDAGFEAAVIDGIGLLTHRFNGSLDDSTAVARLSATHGGVKGLLGKAEIERRLTGCQKSHGVASAAVKILNAGRGGNKLPDWFKE